MDWLLLIVIVAILTVPYAQILSTVISDAYFKAKFKYQRDIVNSMSKSGEH